MELKKSGSRFVIWPSALLLAGVLSGCNTGLAPYLGHWDGSFEVDSVNASLDRKKIDANALAFRGYVQLYQTGDRFLIELGNPSQKLSLKGKWKVLPDSGRSRDHMRTVQLTTKDFVLEEPPLEILRVSGKPYFEPSALHATFDKPLVLRLSADGSSFESSLTTIGPLLGKFHFVKGNTKIGAKL